MKRLSALLPALALACATARPPSPQAGAPASESKAEAPADGLRGPIDALAAPLVKDGWLKGVAIGVVRPQGNELFFYGSADAQGNPVGPETLFEIGSLSKAFTSVLLAEMAGRGEVRLDEPVAALLPGARIPSRDGAPITLEHLATHSSGLPRMPDNFAPANPSNPYADYTVENMLAFLASHELSRSPGGAAEYSNLAVGLLGHALATRAGKPYEQLVHERICTPLGMEETAVTLTEEQLTRFAAGFDADGGPAAHWDIPTFAAAGALRSTAPDLLVFLRANLGLVESPLGPVLAETHRPRRKMDAANEMALGWMRNPENGIVWHNGQTGGFHSFFAFQKEEGVGVVVLANAGTPLVDQLGSAVLRMLRGKPYALKLRSVVELPAETLERYVGAYALGKDVQLTIELSGAGLRARVTGQPAFGIYPESETAFFYRVVPARLVFELDEGDRVTGLKLEQNGASTPARRLP